MHELLLLRHAQAEPCTAGADDRDRPLSARGQDQARATGQWLAGRGIRPDKVLCSPALRTRTTTRLVIEALPEAHAPVTFVDGIYEASPGELLAVLEQYADAATSLLLVGHNPGLPYLVALLCPDARHALARGMPPATLARITLEGACQPGAGRLHDFFTP